MAYDPEAVSDVDVNWIMDDPALKAAVIRLCSRGHLNASQNTLSIDPWNVLVPQGFATVRPRAQMGVGNYSLIPTDAAKAVYQTILVERALQYAK